LLEVAEAEFALRLGDHVVDIAGVVVLARFGVLVGLEGHFVHNLEVNADHSFNGFDVF
jgi:hypothetical protein